MAKQDRVGLHFIHVSKAGGTTIKAILGDRNLRRTPDGTRVILHAHATTVPEVLARDPRNVVAFFLRHPVSRFVSGFNGRMRQGAPARSNPWKPAEELAFGHFKTPDELAVALSSESTTTQDHAFAAMEAMVHTRLRLSYWLHDVDYLRRRLDRIAFVGFQEHYAEDAPRFFALVGLPSIDVPAENQAPATSPVELSAEGRANLERWYADDLAIYRWAIDRRDRWTSGE